MHVDESDGGRLHECRDIAAAEDDGLGFRSMDFDGCKEAYACEEHPRVC